MYERGSRKPLPPMEFRPLALAYCRVSTAEQVEHGASLDAQRDILTAEGERRGYRVEVVTDEGISAKDLRRPGLQSALARLDAGHAVALLAVRIDRISRSIHDFSGLMERSQKKGWSLITLSPVIDPADPSGEFIAHILAAAAQHERRLISVRVKEGMARRRAEGVHLGRHSAQEPETVAEIVLARRRGHTLGEIARQLDASGVPTVQGGRRWWPSTVRAVLHSAAAREVDPS